MSTKKERASIWFALILLVIFFALVRFYLKAHEKLSGSKMSAYGTLGDYFGGISNPILAFITFSAVLFTVNLQLKQSHEAKKLNFEATFFNMITLLVNIRSKLKYREFDGGECFEKIIKDKLLSKKIITITYPLTKPDERPFRFRELPYKNAKQNYAKFNKENNHYLGHYFRTLYRILKIIDGSTLDPEDKKSYSRVLRAQLSMDELSLLFLNCLRGVCDSGEFQLLLYRYSMLEHLSVEYAEHPHVKMEKENHLDAKLVIGGKILVNGRDVRSYILKNGSHYYQYRPKGAFGDNPSQALRDILSIIKKEKSASR